MSQMKKTCTKIEDLICKNCIYSLNLPKNSECHLKPPSPLETGGYAVHDLGTCGSGEWYCEVAMPNGEPLQPHRFGVCSKSQALYYFMPKATATDEKSVIIESLKQIPGLFPEGKSVLLWDLRIPPKSVFVTDKTIEFTVKADLELK